MDILRRKVKLNQPYAGIFVKRDDDNQTEVVASMDELYSIGTFAQIVELQDLGSRLRMVLMAHRRILLTEQHVDESLVETPAVDVVEGEEKPEVQVSSEEMEAHFSLLPRCYIHGMCVDFGEHDWCWNAYSRDKRPRSS